MNTISELCIFKSVYIPNFSLSWQFWFSGPNLPKKSISRERSKKVNDINLAYLKFLGAKLQLQKENFPQKGIRSQKQKKWTKEYTEFCIFKLVLVPNFNLNWQFCLSGPNLPKKGISSLNQKKWTQPLNSAYSNQSAC